MPAFFNRILTALMLGRRFSVVTFARALEPWYAETIEAHGLAGRSAGVRCADRVFASLETVGAEMEDHLVELARRAVEEDGADVVVLGGAPLAGVAGRVKHRIPVPCVDAMAAAVKQAEAIATLAPAAPRAGRFARPPGKPSLGLAPALADRIAGR